MLSNTIPSCRSTAVSGSGKFVLVKAPMRAAPREFNENATQRLVISS